MRRAPEPYCRQRHLARQLLQGAGTRPRVAWIAGPRAAIKKLTLLKQATDLHTATLNQMIAYDLVSSGLIERHTQVIIDEYRRRREVMLEALAKNFPEGFTWTRPQGGMSLWVTLPEGTDADALLQTAIEHKVAFVPGTHFFAHGGFGNTMRLNFSNAAPAKIREGISRWPGC